MCKLLMMVRTGGYILSSLLLVVLSIDRLVNIIGQESPQISISSYIQPQVQFASLIDYLSIDNFYSKAGFYCLRDVVTIYKQFTPLLNGLLDPVSGPKLTRK